MYACSIKAKLLLMPCLIIILFVLNAILLSRDSYAAQLNVPSQYSTIQDAINSAQNGDTISVSPGTYRENLVINHKYITLSGSADAQSVVLAGNPGQTPLLIENVPYVAGGKTVVTGFKITNGYAPDGQGGGITIVNNADPQIYNNTIEHNTAATDGGGISIYNNSNPLIYNNIIRYNNASLFGGGIFVVNNSSPSIVGNQLIGNSVAGGSISGGGPSGGGIYLENNSSNPTQYSEPVVANNTISTNTADFAGGGLMLRVGVNAIVQGNTIDSNSAPYGGGIHSETEGSSPKVLNNTITNNRSPSSSAYTGSGFGAGISVYNKSNIEIDGNTISGNQSTNGGAGIVAAENATVTINRNTISNNAATGSGTVQGGGIYLTTCTGTITNNLFNGDSASVGGAVAVINQVPTLSIANNTFVNNSEPMSKGGAVFVANDSNNHPSIVNNIFSQNQNFQIFEEYSHSYIANNDITNSGSGIYFNYNTNGINSISTLNSSSYVNAENNIAAAPQFVSSSDFHITSSSPVIGIGQSGYVAEDKDSVIRKPIPDAGAYEYSASPVSTTPIYRFWSPANGAHFYTDNQDEMNMLLQTNVHGQWQYEGVAYNAFSSNVANSIPLYRFYSAQYGGHFYTASDAEKNYIIANYPTSEWNYEGVAYYVYPTNTTASSQSVFRFWSPSYQQHFYTSSQAESNYIQQTYPANAWTYEGQVFNIPY